MSGGEIGGMALIDSVARLIPGVVGNPSSVLDESFMHGLLDYPHLLAPLSSGVGKFLMSSCREITADPKMATG